MKIYFAAAITYASPEYLKFVSDLKDELRKHFEILDFALVFDLKDSRAIFEHDVSCVREADAIVAECSYPSTGLGYELGLAVSLGKPIIAIARDDAKVSQMIVGLNHSPFKYLTYKNSEEVLHVIPTLLKELVKV